MCRYGFNSDVFRVATARRVNCDAYNCTSVVCSVCIEFPGEKGARIGGAKCGGCCYSALGTIDAGGIGGGVARSTRNESEACNVTSGIGST